MKTNEFKEVLKGVIKGWHRKKGFWNCFNEWTALGLDAAQARSLVYFLNKELLKNPLLSDKREMFDLIEKWRGRKAVDNEDLESLANHIVDELSTITWRILHETTA